MNLIELTKEINDVDDDLIIFLKDINDYKSKIILSYPEDGDEGIKEVDNVKYYYLLEIFLAKEFIDDWVASLDYSPSNEDIAKRLYEYAINDA